MPTSRRISSIRLRSLTSSTPSTLTRPCWNSSSALMQRIRVDLPEPDGPQITMRSPLETSRLMSRRTWNSPYHLLRPWMPTIESVLMIPHSVAAMRVQPVLDEQGIPRHAKTEDEVDDPGERKAGEQRGRRRPVWIGKRPAQRSQQIEQRDDRNQRGVLEQADEAVDEVGDDVAQRLRHHDQRRGLAPGQAERARRLTLPARDCLQAAADVLSLVGAGKQRDPDQGAHQSVDGETGRNEQRQHIGCEEQHRDQRNPAPELDEGDRENPDQRY